MGSWTVEGMPRKRFGCFAQLVYAAHQQAKRMKRAVLVTFHGRRPPHNTRVDMSNFLMFPGGRKDPTVDPTWHTNTRR